MCSFAWIFFCFVITCTCTCFLYMYFFSWGKYILIIIYTVCTLYCLNLFNLIVTCAFTWNTFTVYSFSCRCMVTSSLSPAWTSPTTAHCWCRGQRTGTSRSGGLTSETATSLSLLMMTGKLKQISWYSWNNWITFMPLVPVLNQYYRPGIRHIFFCMRIAGWELIC